MQNPKAAKEQYTNSTKQLQYNDILTFVWMQKVFSCSVNLENPLATGQARNQFSLARTAKNMTAESLEPLAGLHSPAAAYAG